MAKKTHYTVTAQQMLAPNVYRVELSGDTSRITAAGQFVNIRLEGKFLRRPISNTRRRMQADTQKNAVTHIFCDQRRFA